MEENVNESRERKDREAMESDEEIKINYRGWKIMPLIIGNETFERLGTLGTISNLLIYLTSVFNMKSITAATTINIFKGTTNLCTLIGAFLCDTYFGRFKTLGFCVVASFMGLLAVQLTAAISKLHPPHCGLESGNLCKGPTRGQMSFLLTGFGLLIIGAGGIRPCNLAFGADQFNPHTESGKRGINSFFNWYFFTYTFAQMISLTLIVYVQSNVSWAIGLAIPAGLMFLSCVAFFSASNIYVKVKATGSPLTSVARVVVVAIKKRWLKPVDQPWLNLYNYIPLKSINSKLAYTNQFRFLDKAALLTDVDETNSDGSPTNPWKLCTMQQVEEVKCLLRVLPISFASIIYFLALVQQNTYFVFQAVQSDRRLLNTNFQIPAASYIVFIMLTLTMFIPIYDRVLVPYLKRITKKESGITILQRIGIGIFISVLTMVVSGIVEEKRRNIALTKPTLGSVPRRGGISSMSGLWLVPQLALAGLAEGFASVGQLEFYYKEFPENMRSVAGSFFYVGMAISSYLSTFLISVVHSRTEGAWLTEDLNKGRLDNFYYLIAGLGFLNFGYFLVCAKWYKYKRPIVIRSSETTIH